MKEERPHLYAVIRIPDFPLQAVLRHAPEAAVALVDETLPKARIACVSPAARNAGVREGMAPPQALSRCPELLLKARSRPLEEAARGALLQCAYGFSPRIEAAGEGICTLDLSDLRANSGSAANDGKALAHSLLEQLESLHLHARAGIARTPLLAFHASRVANPILAVEDSAFFLAALPLEYAFCDAPPDLARDKERRKVFDILAAWGVETFGELAALGADRIAERLGPTGLELHACATEKAWAIRPLRLVLPPEIFEEAMEFEKEIETLEPLLFILRRFVEQIALRLEMAHLSARELRLRLQFSAGAPYERLFQIPAPTRCVDVLFRMLHTHLENFTAEHPIVALHLSAMPCRPACHQFGLFETALRDPNLFHETVARLTALLGADRVGTPVAEETHRPDAFHMLPPSLKDSDSPAHTMTAARPPAPGAVLALRRYRPPLPASVLLREERPVFVTTASFSAPVEESRGPWRGSGQWWEPGRWAQEEWDIRTGTGQLYRISQQSEGWFVQGELG